MNLWKIVGEINCWSCLKRLALLGLVLILVSVHVSGTEWASFNSRILTDTAENRPIVAHVVVALCDNKYQGIIPVPASLGNGQNPSSNLYWGAGGGVKSYLTRKGGWTLIETKKGNGNGVLETIILHQKLPVLHGSRDVYIVAEAWDGQKIGKAIERFLGIASGVEIETEYINNVQGRLKFQAGGGAHLIAYVGHDGLMDAPLAIEPKSAPTAKPRGAVVLACASERFFGEELQKTGAFPLIMTTGLMAPEAYTLDAIVKSVARNDLQNDVRESAAQAYNKFQKCGINSARKLFQRQ